MARKNNPEQTREKIISISGELFLKKGFDKTSMQDIVNELKMSKGAIFHHFQSKEAILQAVMDRQSQILEEVFCGWLQEMDGMTAKQKLIGLLEKNVATYDEMHDTDEVFASQEKNPWFIVRMMDDAVQRSAPFFSKIIKEGLIDGSIQTEYPDECAEVFFLLLNIWCSPTIFECTPTKLTQRLKFLQKMMRLQGVDIVTDELIEKMVSIIRRVTGK